MFDQRSIQLERIDTGDYTSEEYDNFLIDIRRINRLLGDSRALKNSMLQDIGKKKLKEFSVLDVGAGSGELLRVCGEFAKRQNLRAELFGLELNKQSAQAMRIESANYKNIHVIRGDAFRLPFAEDSFDYVISSLFLHHFTDEAAMQILREMKRLARQNVYVIDLERNAASHFLYTKFVGLFLRSDLTKQDGALSILRGFKKNELETLAEKADYKEIVVQRHFPYRVVLSGK